MSSKDNNIFLFINKLADSSDIDTIIDIAEVVLALIPGGAILGKVIKVLAFVKKAKPLVGQTALAANNLVDRMDSSKDDFRHLFNLALDDGKLSKEEKDWLRPRALKAGYSEDEFEFMVMKKKAL